MKIQPINQTYKNQNNRTIPQNFKAINSKEKQEKNILKSITFMAFAVASGITIATDSLPKIKELIKKTIRLEKQYAKIEIPLTPKLLQLDSQKLRQLPKELKTQAINALNNALTADEKQAVIRKFNIGS